MVILVVDDELPALNGILSILERSAPADKTVLSASNMKQAVEILDQCKIDILLTDIEMKNGSGLDLIQHVGERGLGCVCVILSAYPDFNYARRAIELGVYEYLLKPIDDSELERAILKAAERAKRKASGIEEAAEEPEADRNGLIKKVKKYILDNITYEISRDDIAKHVSLSPEYLSKFFKKQVGLSLSDFIKDQRIGVAKTLLSRTNLPVGLIAVKSGFSTLSYFSYVFRQETGHSPSRYRAASE